MSFLLRAHDFPPPLAPPYAIKRSLAEKNSFCLSGGLGFDVLLGEMWTLGSLEYEGPGAVFNARMGIAGEVTGSYRINNALAVNLGGRFAWHFYDSDKCNREFKKEAAEYGWNWFGYSYDFFAGVTYSL